MEEKSLSIAFADSLTEESISCVSDYLEIGLDAVMDDGILKDIPIVSTAIALYKIGSSIKERHNLKKLLVFLNELNNGILDEQKRKEYQQKFQSNEKFRNQEIEYLLVLIDRYISYDKPQLLAKLYLAYLDGIIIWEELTMYAEVVDRLLYLDCNFLMVSLVCFGILKVVVKATLWYSSHRRFAASLPVALHLLFLLTVMNSTSRSAIPLRLAVVFRAKLVNTYLQAVQSYMRCFVVTQALSLR